MRQGLIGHTGFVGRTLAAAQPYDATFNSRSIEGICGQRFDRLVCAGVSAVKWKANLDPDADQAGIERLLDPLREARAGLFVLISTVDVYPDPRNVDEATVIAADSNHAYGRHRLALGNQVRAMFPRVVVVRLPALFGPHLAKNVIFDLLNDNQLDKINAASAFQWYDLAWLDRDLEAVEASGLDLVNFAVEPIATREIVDAFFPDRVVADVPETAVTYDMHSRHAAALGGRGPYLKQREQVMAGLGTFVAGQRR